MKALGHAKQDQRVGTAIFVEGFRLLLVLVGAAGGLEAGKAMSSRPTSALLGATLGALLAYVVGGITGRYLHREIRSTTRRLRGVPPAEVFAGAVVGMTGLVLVLILGAAALAYFRDVVVFLVVAVVGWVVTAFGVEIGVAKARQIVAAAGLSRRLAAAVEVLPEGALLLDSSAVMDRSLLVLAKARLLPPSLVVPQFVIDEVELLSSSPDPIASRRAKKGLEALDAIRRGGIHIEITDLELPEVDDMEGKFVILAERLGIRPVTCSVNVAGQLRRDGHEVLDLRQVGAAMSPEHIPGERLTIDLVQPGRQPGQAVGYLPDGDMVVVNAAADRVGQRDVRVVVTASRQTTQGMLVFASIARDA